MVKQKELKARVMKITIPTGLTTLNEYVNAERRNRYIGAKIKHQQTDICRQFVQSAMAKGVRFNWPCTLHFTWHLKNKRKDPDNVAFAKKFILDGMQQAGFAENDNAKYITGFVDDFAYDGYEGVEIEAI